MAKEKKNRDFYLTRDALALALQISPDLVDLLEAQGILTRTRIKDLSLFSLSQSLRSFKLYEAEKMRGRAV